MSVRSFGGDRSACRGVLFLWPLLSAFGPASAAEVGAAVLESAGDLCCAGALSLVQALARSGWRHPPRLWIVTRGRYAVSGADRLSLAQSPLLGLARVIRSEAPELRYACVDLDPSAAAEEALALVRELQADGPEEERALRSGRRHVARLSRFNAATAAPRPATKWVDPAAEGLRLDTTKPGDLVLRAAERRAPGPGEVEIPVRCAGLNGSDVMKAMGVMAALFQRFGGALPCCAGSFTRPTPGGSRRSTRPRRGVPSSSTSSWAPPPAAGSGRARTSCSRSSLTGPRRRRMARLPRRATTPRRAISGRSASSMMPTHSTPWIRFRRSAPGARLRLFCFPHAGGAATAFRHWVGALPSFIEVCPLQPPGRLERAPEPLLRRMEDHVASLLDGLSDELDKPFAFFGHSLGALVAFELARELRRRKEPGPVHLFASARPAPQLYLPRQATPFEQMADEELLQVLTEQYNAIPNEVQREPELMRMLMPVLRADLEVHEAYVHRAEEPLSCPITVLGGDQDRMIKPEYLDGWRLQTRSRFSIQMYPGDHFFIRQHEAAVLSLIADALAPQAHAAPL